jgi:hypothetical protein
MAPFVSRIRRAGGLAAVAALVSCPEVAAEMALSVLAYNLTPVMNIVGIKPLIAAIAT